MACKCTNLLGTSNYSSENTFITTSVFIPNLTYPINDATVYSLSITLYWWGACTNYDLLYSVNSDMSSATIINNVNSTNYTLTGLANGTTYYWQVRSKTSTGAIAGYSVIESFKTLPQVVTTVIPIPSWPIGGATVYTNSPILYWYLDAVGIGLKYDIEYSTGALTGTATVSNITNSFYALSGLMSGTTYNWQVRSRLASNHAVVSNYSTVESFVTNACCSTPITLIPGSPNENVTIQTDSPTLSWILPVISETELTYEVEISDNVDMINSNLFGELKSPYITLNELSSGTKYYWRARSKNSDSLYSRKSNNLLEKRDYCIFVLTENTFWEGNYK